MKIGVWSVHFNIENGDFYVDFRKIVAVIYKSKKKNDCMTACRCFHQLSILLLFSAIDDHPYQEEQKLLFIYTKPIELFAPVNHKIHAFT